MMKIIQRRRPFYIARKVSVGCVKIQIADENGVVHPRYAPKYISICRRNDKNKRILIDLKVYKHRKCLLRVDND